MLLMLFSLLILFRIKKNCLLLQTQMAGFKYNHTLAQILAKTQQHRGMTTAQLKGDQSFKHKIPKLQQEIKEQYFLLAKEKHPVETYHQQLMKLNTDWQQLQANKHSLTANENFHQHCYLINRLLDLIEIIASHHQLNHCTKFSAKQIDLVWRILPGTAEAIGQARAIGSGIAASGESNAIDRIKIGFLNKKIQTALKSANNYFSKKNELPSHFKKDIDRIHSDANQLVEVMQNNFIIDQTPSVSSQKFFDEATQLLGNIFTIYNDAENYLQDQTQTILEQSQNRLTISYCNMAVLLVLFSLSLFF